MTSKTPRYVTDTILNFIGGSYRQGSDGKTFINVNPATAQKIGTALEASESDVAVAAATAALNGPWGRIKTAERLKLIGAAANEIERRSDDFIEAEVADTGKPRHVASHIDIPRSAANFRMFADVVALANDSDYGLSETIWTENVSRAHRVAAAMRVGVCWVNCWFLRDLRTAFGGSGHSGIGRESGVHSLEFYTETEAFV